MRRLERMVEAHQGTRQELVKMLSHQTCIQPRQVYNLVKAIDLQKEILQVPTITERPQPTILIECLPAPDPVALAKVAIEEEWTAGQVRLEALRQNAEAQGGHETAPAPQGTYHTIVVDPPWSYGNNSGRQRTEYADRAWDLSRITAFKDEWLGARIPDDWCHLYLWATDIYAGDVNAILEAWGFTPKVWLVWVKDRFGMGNYYRHQHELCMFATRGKQRLKRKNASTVFYAPITKHSEKPDAFYALVESCSYGPFLDVFARKHRAGWDVWGDEVEPSYQKRFFGDNESQHLDKQL